MNIIITSTLSSNQFHDASTLIELCRLADHTRGVSFLENHSNAIEEFPAFYLMYNDNILVSILSVFVPDSEQCEIYANTLPRFRGKGYFRTLFQKAYETIHNYNISKIYFVNEPCCISGAKALEHIGAMFEKSEYLLSYNMNTPEEPSGILDWKWKRQDETEYLIETCRNEQKVGEIHLHIENHVASIYHVEILPKFRGRGFGTETLLLAIQYLKVSDCDKILLHVSGDNRIAYKLYTQHGFVHVDQLDYWKINVQ